MTSSIASLRRLATPHDTRRASPGNATRWILAWTGLLASSLMPLAAQAIDVDPADFVPAPAGTTAGLFYLQHVERDSLYSHGHQPLDDPRLDSNIGIARLVHYTQIGGVTVAPQILQPFGRLEASHDTQALGDASGLADTILAMPFWLINDPQARSYLAIAPYLFLPTGRYNHDHTLNLGENRWKFDLQVGYVKGLSAAWYLDLTGDVMFFGKNDDYTAAKTTLEQKPLYQGQAALRYQFSPGANAFVELSQTWGGESRVAGADLDDEACQRKITIGGSYFIQPKTQLMVSVGRDLEVENGFKEDARLNIRLLQIF